MNMKVKFSLLDLNIFKLLWAILERSKSVSNRDLATVLEEWLKITGHCEGLVSVFP